MLNDAVSSDSRVCCKNDNEFSLGNGLDEVTYFILQSSKVQEGAKKAENTRRISKKV